MGARLLYRDDSGREASVDVLPEGAFLGRGVDCLVRTNDAMVSRKNCKISLAAGHWVVEDLGSSNGTFVNEVRVQKQLLSHADVVRCGTLQVRFVELPDAATALPEQAAGRSEGASPLLQRLFGASEPSPALSLELQPIAQERDALAARLREASQELEAAQLRADAAQEELRRLRTELGRQREQLAQLQRDKAMQEDELQALTKVGNELREERAQLQSECLSQRQRAEELADEVATRDRQLERAYEDVQRAKSGVEELHAKLGELQKTKDEGWRELNERVGELEQLREVLNEQERLLDERKVGLTALEAAVKDARGEKERLARAEVTLKRERDELRDQVERQQQKIAALEEAERHLARRLSEAGAGAGLADPEDEVRMTQELRELKLTLRKGESERARLAERLEAAERERGQLEEQLAKVEIERTEVAQSQEALRGAKGRIEERLARAEAARALADEARQAAEEARAAALDEVARATAGREHERTRAAELELELLRRCEAIAPPGAAPALQTAFKAKAEEVCGGVNDALSELRTNVLLAQELVAEHGAALPDANARHALTEAITAAVERTEGAKDLLRALREIVES